MLPRVSSNLLAGLMETVAAPPFNGTADLPKIASDLQMEIDELFPVAETLQMMRFAEVAGGDIRLTPEAHGVRQRRRSMSASGSSRATCSTMCRWRPTSAGCWMSAPRTSARKSRFIDELEDFMGEDDAEQTLRAVISLARYAEAFAYDDENEMFSLENRFSRTAHCEGWLVLICAFREMNTQMLCSNLASIHRRLQWIIEMSMSGEFHGARGLSRSPGDPIDCMSQRVIALTCAFISLNALVSAITLYSLPIARGGPRY